MPIIRAKPETVIVRKDVINNPKLSYGAIGLYVKICSGIDIEIDENEENLIFIKELIGEGFAQESNLENGSDYIFKGL